MALNQVELADYRVLITLVCCLVRGETMKAGDILRQEAPDFGRLRKIISKSHLGGFFYSLVTKAGLEETLPVRHAETLEATYRKLINRNLRLLGLLTAVKAQMESAAVPFLNLKGFYLSQKFVGDINSRFMWDLDILVRPEDLGNAITAASATGLEQNSRIRLDPRRPAWGLHSVDLRGEMGKLDIHCAIRNLPKIRFDYESIWSNATEFHVNQIRFPTIGDEDTLLIAALGVGTDIQCGHHNLRKVMDIYLILRKLDDNVDWEAFFARRSEEGSLVLILNVFAFCLELLEIEKDCPTLVQSMEPHRSCIRVGSKEEAEVIFARGRQNILNRIFFSTLLPVSPLYYWVWWLKPLPLRYWYYR